MLDLIEALAPYVPLFQTVVLVLLSVVVLMIFRKQLKLIATVIRERLEAGSHLKAGPLEIGQDLRSLEYINKKTISSDSVKEEGNGRSAAELQTERQELYRSNRDLFLAHVIRPSESVGQFFDVYIYLVRHESQDFSDVKFAEFFFGRHWGNKVFQKREEDSLIGIATSAPGPFLCLCRVTFQDGQKIYLHRYIDFEMSRIFDS